MCMNSGGKPNWFVAAKSRSDFCQTSNESVLCKISAVFVAVEIFTAAIKVNAGLQCKLNSARRQVYKTAYSK